MKWIYIAALTAGLLGCAISQDPPSLVTSLQPAKNLQATRKALEAEGQPSSTPNPTLANTSIPAVEPILTPTPDPTPVLFEIPSYFPLDLQAEIATYLPVNPAGGPGGRSVGIDGEVLIGEWLFVPAIPFRSLRSGITSQELLSVWRGDSAEFEIWIDPESYRFLSEVWGDGAADTVQIISVEGGFDEVWRADNGIRIMPFHRLDPAWKVIEIDERSPLQADFEPPGYPLSIPISLENDQNWIDLVRNEPEFVEAISFLKITNFLPERLTTVSMTGVTALVRATAHTMEIQGVAYPGIDVAEILTATDFTHINNEVPFVVDCPYPDPVQEGVVFCSRDAYIALLESVGTDIVELSGDHFSDWGQTAVLHTLELYEERGWHTYGGGHTLEEGRQPLVLKHNGNSIAFIGCNAKGVAYARASAVVAGAAACDFVWMETEIARLREEGHIVISTFQHFEYYDYIAYPNQKRDFRRMADAGASVVSGSQAHQPQAMEFHADAFIHYGLGNLFFDQFSLCDACREGTIDIHTFYDGRHIQTEIVPILFIDYARPRLMTEDEANALFRRLATASGW